MLRQVEWWFSMFRRSVLPPSSLSARQRTDLGPKGSKYTLVGMLYQHTLLKFSFKNSTVRIENHASLLLQITANLERNVSVTTATYDTTVRNSAIPIQSTVNYVQVSN